MKNPKMSLLSAMKNQYDCVIHILETRPYNKYQIQNKYVCVLSKYCIQLYQNVLELDPHKIHPRSKKTFAKYSPIPAHGLIVRTPTCIYSCGTVALMHTLIRKLHV